MPINVVLADDHTIVRDGLRALLEADPEIRVVGDASDGSQVVEIVKKMQPNIVVMDISMPQLNGINAAKQILETSPQVKVIFLTMLGTADYVFHALQAGARGFLLKESAGREVMEAVKKVYRGELYFSRPIVDTVINDYMHVRTDIQSDILKNLSSRENEILCLVVDGKTSAEIGKHLNLSPKTVESYRSRMMQKLGVSDLAELIKFAIKHGLISIE